MPVNIDSFARHIRAENLRPATLDAYVGATQQYYREAGNPQALQEQLGHTTAEMTLRQLWTLTADEVLRIKEGVDFRW